MSRLVHAIFRMVAPGALLLLTSFVLSILAFSASSEPDAVVPPRPSETKASKAYAVLETRCARCHQSGKLEAPTAATGFLNVLALDDLTRDPSLVRPGLPDASPLYTTLLRRAMPPDSWRDEAFGKTGPTVEEIEAVRDWIESLPLQPSKACSPRPLVKPADIPIQIGQALRKLPRGTLRRMRFVTLFHLHNACLPVEEIATHRAELVQLLRRMAKKPDASVAGEVDAAGLILRIDLDRLGWTPAEWDRLVAAYPYSAFYPYDSFDGAVALESIRRLTGTTQPIVRGDWLAHAFLRHQIESTEPPQQAAQTTETSPPATPETAPPPTPPLPSPVARLARLYERDAGLLGVAAELGLEPAELTKHLSALPTDYQTLSRRIARGLLSRDELIQLEAAVSNIWDTGPSSQPPGGAAPISPPPLRLSLWTDKPAYAPHDLVTLSAKASSDCYLTVISVDAAGKATVLFPNELEQDNHLKGGAEISVPGAAANYQFRVGERGQETIVGLCTVTRKIAPGIRLDYERQRFTSLGNWRAFLNRSLTETNTVQRLVEARTPRWRRRVQRIRVLEKLEPLRPEHHARTAIVLEVR